MKIVSKTVPFLCFFFTFIVNNTRLLCIGKESQDMIVEDLSITIHEKYPLSFSGESDDDTKSDDDTLSFLKKNNYSTNQSNSFSQDSSPLSPKGQPLSKKKKGIKDLLLRIRKKSNHNSQGNVKYSMLGKKAKSVGDNLLINNQQAKPQGLKKAFAVNENGYDNDNFIGDYSKAMKCKYKGTLVDNKCEKGLQFINDLLPKIAMSSAYHISEESKEKIMFLYCVLSFARKKENVIPKRHLVGDGIPLPTSPHKGATTTRELRRYIISNTGMVNKKFLQKYVHAFNFHFVKTTPGHPIVALMQFMQKLNDDEEPSTIIKPVVLYTNYAICQRCYWLAGELLEYNRKELPLQKNDQGCLNLAFPLPLKGLARRFVNVKLGQVILHSKDRLSTVGQIAWLFEPEKEESKEKKLAEEMKMLRLGMNNLNDHIEDLQNALNQKLLSQHEFSSRSNSFYNE